MINRTGLLLLISFCLLCLLASHPVAKADDYNTIEQMLTELESGITIPQTELTAKITYLKNQLSERDRAYYLRLQAIICWNFDADTPKQRTLAINFANKQINNPFIQQSPEHHLDIQLCKAWFNQIDGKVTQALKEYDEVIQRAYQIESLKLIADGRSIRGAMHSFQGNFSLALEDLITAQHLYDNLGLNHWSQINLSDLATSYRRFGDPQTAIKYYKQLEARFTKLNDIDAATAMITEMAIAYEELGEYNKAIEYYQKSYDHWQKQGDTFSASAIAVNISGSLIKLNRISEAREYLSQASPHISSKDEAFYSFMKLFEAEISLIDENPSEALDALLEAKSAFNRVKNKRGLAQLSQIESQVYTSLGDWPKAFQALERYVQLHNELDAKMQSNRTTEMRTRFNTEQIETENKQLIELQKARELELHILEQNRYLQLAVIILAVIVILFISLFAIKQVQKSKLLAVLALTDHLTKLPNRRQTYSEAEKHFSDNNSKLSLILFDADHFKKINDNFGHEIGDKVLFELANISNLMMRKTDLVGRVGGEEFLIILPDTTLEQAIKIANRLVESIAKTDLSHLSPTLSISVSAGVAEKEQDASFSELLNRADTALYEAKTNGRNRAVFNTQQTD
ncbi:GGDEF domain-containing protein [Shewanella sp. NR704-98]|uniref:diguanylate cyclase n=1 Tax=Shewanella nanhaiensis TaxID=2864872 RepID=A0ABS7DXN3_9GAMM|nr:GGDEF domain-containing protein [Shewanella nanhaiensis]